MQRWRPPFGVGQERLALLAPLLPDSALTLVGPQTEAESRVTPPWSRWCCVGIGSGRAALLLFVTLFPLFGTSVPLPPCVGCVDAWVSLANQMVVLVPGCCDRDWPCRLFRTPLASCWGSAGPSQLPLFSSVAMRLSLARGRAVELGCAASLTWSHVFLGTVPHVFSILANLMPWRI